MYWLGLPRPTIIAISFLQGLAAIGYLVWFFWLLQEGDRIQNSILSSRWNRTLLVSGFLLASVVWPYLAYYHQLSPISTRRAVLASLPLWIAALCVILLIGGTFEAKAPAHATIGILFLGMIVVLADGVGWTAACIKQSL